MAVIKKISRFVEDIILFAVLFCKLKYFHRLIDFVFSFVLFLFIISYNFSKGGLIIEFLIDQLLFIANIIEQLIAASLLHSRQRFRSWYLFLILTTRKLVVKFNRCRKILLIFLLKMILWRI